MKGKYRYVVLGLLFLATTINYIDRQVIGLLKPMLEKDLHWTEQDYGNIIFWFQVMYAVGYLLAGRFVDKAGAKIGYGIAVLLWSLSAIANGFVKTITGFKVARGGLGFAEGGNFPAAIKAIAEWFPVKERSLASGIMVSGTTVGPILAPALVVWLATSYGWQTSFIVTGALGLLWLVAWDLFYDKPSKQKYVTQKELACIQAGTAEPTAVDKVPVGKLLNKKATWGYFIALFLTDPVWWFYLFWLPSFLTSSGMPKSDIAFPVTVVYGISAALSIAGGWLSSYFIKRGWGINSSRKITMLICICMALPVMLIRYTGTVWPAVFIIAVAAAAQTIWKGVLLTTVADQFPKKAVSTVAGIGGFGGAIGGVLAAPGIGMLLGVFKANNNIQGGYNLVFILCGLSYTVAMMVFHALSPKLAKVEV